MKVAKKIAVWGVLLSAVTLFVSCPANSLLSNVEQKVNSAQAGVPVTGVSLSPTTLTLVAGGATSTLKATITPANATNQSMAWSSSAASVATVSGGVVTPVAAGTATITVTTADGNKTATCAVTVLSTNKAITAFSIVSPVTATGTITGTSIAVTVPYGANVTALVATFTTTGKSVSVNGTAQTSGTTPNNFTSPVVYMVTAADGSTQNYTVTVTAALNSAKAITAFSFTSPAATGVITQSNFTIAVTLPYGSSLANPLVATFTTTGKSVSVGSTVQVSGTTANNFTNPVTYTVTAQDGSTQSYTVTVTVALASSKSITAFSFASPAATGVINQTNFTIAVTVPYNTNLSNPLVASFTYVGASVSVGSTIQTSGNTQNNFSSPVTYTVTAADGSTQSYKVTVTLAPAITAFSFTSPVATGIINQSNFTIAVSVPSGTNLTNLVATFATTGTSVTATVGSNSPVPQTSGTTAVNFTSPVVYTVTTANGLTQNYTVTVSFVYTVTYNANTTGYGGTVPTDPQSPYLPGATVTVLGFSALTKPGYTLMGWSTQSTGSAVYTQQGQTTFTMGNSNVALYAVWASLANTMLTFSIVSPAENGTITGTNIAVTVPYGTLVTALVASFTVSSGATVSVGSTPQQSGFTSNSFTNSVAYKVTAADGSSIQTYTVTVAPPPFTTYSGVGVTGVNGVAVSGSIICATTSSNLQISTNGGTSWTAYQGGMGLSFTGVAMFGSTIYAAAVGGEGGSLRIGTLSSGSYSFTGVGMGSPVYGVAVDSSGNIYVATGGGVQVGTLSSGTYNWAAYTNGLGNNTVNGIAVDSSGNIYAATVGGLSISTNGGTSFENYTTSNGLGYNYVSGVAVSGSTIYAATGGGLSISPTTSISFTNYTTSNGLGSNGVQSVTVSSSTIYAATNNGLSISTNGGANWVNYTTANGLSSNIISDVAISGSTIYAATSSGVSVAPISP
jgi:hypothetical protein